MQTLQRRPIARTDIDRRWVSKLDPRRTIHENALARGRSLRRLEIRGTWSLSMPANSSRHSGRDSACSPKSPRAFWRLARFPAEQKSAPRKISSRHSTDTFPREDKNQPTFAASKEREREEEDSQVYWCFLIGSDWILFFSSWDSGNFENESEWWK